MALTSTLAHDRSPRARWLHHDRRSILLLALILFVLLLGPDTMGFLSTDVGGKVATLEAMDRNGGLSPDLGYWAEPADPDGSLFPMFTTLHIDDRWVNVTTLPMLIVALPFYRLGGLLFAGLIPLLGTVLAAQGARVLARRLGADGTLAFWIVGIASPATIYALDFWEHSLGLALMLWAVVLSLDASRERGALVAALGAGLLFGAAASMRQEAIVYGFVAGMTVGVRHLANGRVVGSALRGGFMLAGIAAMTFANSLLETAVLGDSTRAGRSTTTAVKAGGNLTLRVKEAILTSASPFGSTEMIYLVLAVVLVVALAELGRRANDDTAELRPVVIAAGAIAAMALIDLVGGGLRFVPGLAATTPVAALALTQCWRTSDRRAVAAIAIVSLPLVWAVQYTGGAAPQWGGRYILLTGALLVVLATVVLTTPRARQVLLATAGVGLAVTLIGFGWTVERTHSFADAMDELAEREEPVLVFHDPHLAREGGIHVLDEQWLVATGETARAEAVDVLRSLDIEQIGFVQHDRGDDPIVLPGWEVVADERVPLVSGLFLRVTTQEPVD